MNIPGIPAEVALLEEGLGQRGVGFFAETFHFVNGGIAVESPFTLLDIAETRTRPRRLDADGEQRARLSRGLCTGEQIAAECGGVFDQMVGGQHGHNRLRIAAQDKTDPEGNRGRGVALGGLGHDVFGRKPRAGGAHRGFLLAVGQDEDPLRRDGIPETGNRFLQHGMVGEKLEQLLGTRAAAVGPKTLAATAG